MKVCHSRCECDDQPMTLGLLPLNLGRFFSIITFLVATSSEVEIIFDSADTALCKCKDCGATWGRKLTAEGAATSLQVPEESEMITANCLGISARS
jgi:hypothetical protein